MTLGSGNTIFYSTFNSLAVNASSGNDTINITGDSIPTTVTAGSGTVHFTVGSNSVPLILNGAGGADTYTINSNSGPLTINGAGGTNAFVVNSSSSGMTLNGGTSTNTYTINSNSASLTIGGAGTANNVTVNANSGSLTVNGSTGTDSFTVNGTTGSVALHGGTGSTTYLISAPTLAPVNVIGNASGTGALTFDGTTLTDVFSITGTTLNAGSGATVTYSNLTSLTVNGQGGADTYLMSADTTPTTLNGTSGNSTYSINSISAALVINTGTGTSVNTVNLGSNEPASSGNTLANITASVTITGDGLDTLNIDDSATTAARSGTLTPTALSGIATGTIHYSGLAALNLKLGSGGNTLNVTGSASGTATNLTAGTRRATRSFLLAVSPPRWAGSWTTSRATLR